jgi:hypothetical protein
MPKVVVMYNGSYYQKYCGKNIDSFGYIVGEVLGVNVEIQTIRIVLQTIDDNCEIKNITVAVAVDQNDIYGDNYFIDVEGYLYLLCCYIDV